VKATVVRVDPGGRYCFAIVAEQNTSWIFVHVTSFPWDERQWAVGDEIEIEGYRAHARGLRAHGEARRLAVGAAAGEERT
jgi:hypothetical protein